MFKGGFPGGANMGNLIKQAQKLQADMEKTQEELGNKILEASSGGGAVTVTATGKKELTNIKISPDALDDAEMLQDLILTAVNEVLRKADELVNSEMKKFNLPF
jgi:DNA-binding YbaB/EbfC family protein